MLRAAAVAAAVAAAACAREESPAARTLAVRVNGVELPARIVEAEIARERASGRFNPKEASARGLESAIDQELLVQKALEARLDRDPEVMRALDEGRRRVLANAWLDRALAGRASPDESEVNAFYAANPSLFAQRRIYALREIRVSGPAPQLTALRAAVEAASTPEEIDASLARAGLPRDVHESTQPAEALPLALLAKLQSMKDGQATVVDTAPVVSVVELARSIPAPLAPQQAAPVIERFLAARRRAELARAEIARLREGARIEYPAGQGPGGRERAPREAPAIPVNASLEPNAGERIGALAPASLLYDKDPQS